MLRRLTRVYLFAVLLGAPPVIVWAFARSAGLGAALLVTLGPQWLIVVVIGAMRWVNPPTTAFMWRVARDLRQAGLTAQVERTWRPLAALAPDLQLAAIAGEDAYFAHHTGFDWESLRAAYAANQASGKRARGGSTITQQLAKNLFLWEGRSYVRKAVEAYATLLMEAAWSKRRILEVYLKRGAVRPEHIWRGGGGPALLPTSRRESWPAPRRRCWWRRWRAPTRVRWSGPSGSCATGSCSSSAACRNWGQTIWRGWAGRARDQPPSALAARIDLACPPHGAAVAQPARRPLVWLGAPAPLAGGLALAVGPAPPT